MEQRNRNDMVDGLRDIRTGQPGIGIAGSASDLMHKAQATGCGIMNSAQSEAKQIGDSIHTKVDDTLNSVGKTIASFGGTLREKGSVGHGVTSAMDSVAQSVEQTGEYLSKGVDTIGSDVYNLVRRHPVVAAVVGVGLGIYIGRYRAPQKAA